MNNIFDADKNVNNKIDRNTFDWRHTNHFTGKIGTLYPLFSPLLPPNSKVKVDANAGLQFMPMSFPVQTAMRARMSFFKVPLRILWKDYRDYIGNFKQGLEEPYHDISDKDFNSFYGDCQLADYLDIPNTVYTNDNSLSPVFTKQSVKTTYFWTENGELNPYSVVSVVGSSNPNVITSFEQPWYIHRGFYYELPNIPERTLLLPGAQYTLDLSNMPSQLSLILPSNLSEISTHSFKMDFHMALVDTSGNIIQVIDYDINNKPFLKGSSFSRTNEDSTYTYGINVSSWSDSFQFKVDEDIDASSATRIAFILTARLNNITNPTLTSLQNIEGRSTLSFEDFPEDLIIYVEGQFGYGQSAVIQPSTSPYYSSESNPNGLKLKSYRARAYEAIYNAYYRDNRNNPLYDAEGMPVYNDWLLNYSGGADNTLYQLHKANWEKDFLTTALPSPQQGKSPLVGLTQYIEETPTSSGSNLEYKLALVDESGKKYSVTYTTQEDGTIGGYNIQVGEVLPDNTQVAHIDYSKMLNSVNYGISIPDFRAVNAYQKYLELNIRKGYSYKDIIEGRFDCKVKFDELMMPEYIGGWTRDINMNRVVQSVDSNLLVGATTDGDYRGSLGSLSGDAFLTTDGQVPTISTFCDEECIIMGIFSVIPQPTYTQLLPKDFLYNDVLDHFNPEFNNLGYQPISYAEVCPVQCKAYNIDPTKTFGYQRPWYEYVSKPDTAHGLLRTSFRDFIMNRNFNVPPALSESFLLIDDKQLNDVFQVQTDEDKMLGQCYFDCKVELPINRITNARID